MSHENIIYKNSCAKWVNKLSGEVLYLDEGYDLNKYNPNWFKIPEDALYATYSDNTVRSDVILFWRNPTKQDKNICFDPVLPEKGWFSGGSRSLNEFLTTSSYKGKIVWSKFK